MEDRNQELNKLTRALDRLKINQAELARRQYSLSRAVKVVKGKIEKITNQGQDSNKDEVVLGSGLCIGDKVKVNNPRPGQEDKGEVCGATRDGLIKLRTTTGTVIRRLPKNLTRLNRKNE